MMRTGLIATLCILAALTAGCTGRSGNRSGGGAASSERHLSDARAAMQLFDRGRYRDCAEAFKDWLLAYEDAHWDRAIEVRFFLGLCYVQMGDHDTAREVFADLLRRYGGAPPGHPSTKFLQWARVELKELEPSGP
jgi:TolA-binding protein